MAAKTVREAQRQAAADPLAQAILAAEDLEHEDVPVPEWGGIVVRIRGMDGAARDAYEASLFGLRQVQDSAQVEARLGNRRARMLARCMFNPETDERIPVSAEQLGAKSGKVLDRLMDIALRLSGMDKRAADEAEGNSGAAQSGNSTSG